MWGEKHDVPPPRAATLSCVHIDREHIGLAGPVRHARDVVDPKEGRCVPHLPTHREKHMRQQRHDVGSHGKATTNRFKVSVAMASAVRANRTREERGLRWLNPHPLSTKGQTAKGRTAPRAYNSATHRVCAQQLTVEVECGHGVHALSVELHVRTLP